MWIKKPIPVMINKNKEDKGSYKNSNGIFKVSELIQENNSKTIDLLAACCNSMNAKTETTKEASTLIEAMEPDMPLLIFFPKKPLIKNPIKGNKGTNAINLIIRTFNFSNYLIDRYQ